MVSKRKEPKWLERIRWEEMYDFLYKDVSFVSGFNSMLLIMMSMIFIKFFFIGIEMQLLTTWFEILVIFGMTIILFTTVPIYPEGFFCITNLLVIGGGMLYIIFGDTTLMQLGLKLSIAFAIAYFMIEIAQVVFRRQRNGRQ